MITKLLHTCGILMMTLPPVAPEPGAPPATTAPAHQIAQSAPQEIPPEILRELDQIRRGIGDNPLRGSILDEGHNRLAPQPNPPAGRSPRVDPMDLPREYQHHAIRSINRRLAAIAADLDELGLEAEADRIRETEASLRRRTK